MKTYIQNKRKSGRNYPKEERESQQSAFVARPRQDRRFGRRDLLSAYAESISEGTDRSSIIHDAYPRGRDARFSYINHEEGDNNYNRAV